MTNPAETAAFYAQGSYLFSDGYQAGNAKAGVRAAW